MTTAPLYLIRLPGHNLVLSSKWLAPHPRLAFSETVQDVRSAA